MNVEIGTEAAQFLSGNICFEFYGIVSLQCMGRICVFIGELWWLKKVEPRLFSSLHAG
jgi:hypothetical protein